MRVAEAFTESVTRPPYEDDGGCVYTHAMTTEQDQPATDEPPDSEDQAPTDSRSLSGDGDTADEAPAAAVETDDEEESPDDADTADVDPDVDTGPLERSQAALDEARDAAHEALSDPRPDDDDMDFQNVEQNTDPEAEDNAVPRPN